MVVQIDMFAVEPQVREQHFFILSGDELTDEDIYNNLMIQDAFLAFSRKYLGELCYFDYTRLDVGDYLEGELIFISPKSQIHKHIGITEEELKEIGIIENIEVEFKPNTAVATTDGDITKAC